MSLLTVGSVAFDALETPYGKTDKILGGAATYITLSASYFTKENNMVAVVGGDFPKEMIEVFEKRNVNMEGLQIIPDGKTFYWSGKYHTDMNTRDTLDVQLNVMGEFDPTIPASFQNSTYLMLGNTAPSVQKKVLERMAVKPKLVMLDTMNFWMDTAWDDLLDILKLVDVLTINDEEARQLSGEYSLLFQEDQVFFAPALPLEEVFDPTGAGDTFAGGFIGYLASTDDISFDNMKRAIIYGSAMASFCVEKFGTERLLNLTPKDIHDRVLDFVTLSSFEVR
jgi:sugar/nucleoside kinase (ribokinase family)